MSQLSRLNEAETQARRIIALRADSHTRSRAFGQLMLTNVLIAQGEPEEACAIAQEVLEATHSLGSYLVLQELHDLRVRLAPFGKNRTASELLAQLNEVLRVRLVPYQRLGNRAISEGRRHEY
jgi:hypothetical protein